MNIADISPQWGAAKAIGKVVLAVVAAAVVVAGVYTVAGKITDPFGWKKAKVEKVEGQAVTSGQQAASNAAGAAIGDRRATNVAKIDKTAQEARNAVHDAEDYDAALRGYLDGLDRLRRDGAAPVTDPAADPGRQDPNAGS